MNRYISQEMQNNCSNATEKLSLENDSFLSGAKDSPTNRKLKHEQKKPEKAPEIKGTF